MNLPNKLTLLRIFLVPIFMVFQLFPITRYNLLIALFLFVLASLTDLVDGMLARRNNQVTDFGKIMDPLADKLLVTAALVGFVQLGYINAWVAMIIIGRELLVTSLRVVASGKGRVIAANIWGKVKTVSQMTALIVLMLMGGLHLPLLAGSICMWVAAAFTVISGVQYMWAYRVYLTSTK